MSRNTVAMTVRQQDIMATLCERISGFVYQWQLEKEVSSEKVGDAIWEWFDRAGVKSQELHELYDIFHRSGANQ